MVKVLKVTKTFRKAFLVKKYGNKVVTEQVRDIRMPQNSRSLCKPRNRGAELTANRNFRMGCRSTVMLSAWAGAYASGLTVLNPGRRIPSRPPTSKQQF